MNACYYSQMLVGVESLQNESWACVYSPRKEDIGHKVFKCRRSGRYSIADWSGDFPNETDDGPCWINLETPLLVRKKLPEHLITEDNNHMRRTRYIVLYDDGKHTLLNKGTFRFLRDELKMDVDLRQGEIRKEIK